MSTNPSKKVYPKLTKVSTTDMSHDEWLAERRKGIGGSDAAAVLGTSKYTSAYALWLDKTGKQIPEDISDKESVRLGNDLEQYCADRWMEATGKKCRNCNYILRNPEYPFAHANPDRLVDGEHAGLECKTTSSTKILDQCKKCGRDGTEFPEAYYFQCVHYLMVTGFDTWYLSVLVFGRGLFTFELHRADIETEITALVQAEADFWEMVTTDTPPEIDGSESSTTALGAQFPTGNGSKIDLTPVHSSLLVRAALKSQIDSLQAQMDECDNAIKLWMGEAEYGTDGKYSVSWKSSEGRSTFDSKKFDKDHPHLRDAYMKAGTPSRRFTVTEIDN